MARNLSHYLLDKKKGKSRRFTKNYIRKFFKNENVIDDFETFEVNL